LGHNILKDLYNLAGKNNKAISFYNLAVTSMKQSHYENAINSFLQALKEDNSVQMQSTVRPNLAQAYILNDRILEGIEELTKAKSLSQSNDYLAYIHANLGFAYTKSKNYGFAIKEYKTSLKYKKDPATHYSLAMLYESKYQGNLAQSEIEKALKLAPENDLYEEAYKNLDSTPAVSLKVGRTAQPLNTLGLIVTPAYRPKEKDFYPLVIYLYSESPFLKTVKTGDYITACESQDSVGKTLIEALNVSSGNRAVLTLNGSSRVIANAINPITRKLNETEKIKLYRDWFKSFDSRIVLIQSITNEEEKNDIGTKWGYEFESLIRSWSAYIKQDPSFEQSFFLLMEFFQAYTYSNTEDNEVHYEINLSKLDFTFANSIMINFFKDIGFNETANYLESKTKQSLDKEVLDPKNKLAKKAIKPRSIVNKKA
jgi:hypothetical protein